MAELKQYVVLNIQLNTQNIVIIKAGFDSFVVLSFMTFQILNPCYCYLSLIDQLVFIDSIENDKHKLIGIIMSHKE
jgi:hypothetical protein